MKMGKASGVVLVLLLFAAIVAPNAHATDVTTDYTISFTTTSGSPAPTSGQFVFDDTTGQFLSFTVKWDGITFDLTSYANAPFIGNASPYGPLPTCLTAGAGAAASLSLLLDCSADSQSIWAAATDAFSQEQFLFSDQNTATLSELPGIITITNGEGVSCPCTSAEGQWKVEVAQSGGIPEPATGPLLLMGIGLLVLAMRRRIAPGLQRAS